MERHRSRPAPCPYRFSVLQKADIRFVFEQFRRQRFVSFLASFEQGRCSVFAREIDRLGDVIDFLDQIIEHGLVSMLNDEKQGRHAVQALHRQIALTSGNQKLYNGQVTILAGEHDRRRAVVHLGVEIRLRTDQQLNDVGKAVFAGNVYRCRPVEGGQINERVVFTQKKFNDARVMIRGSEVERRSAC